MAREAGIIDFRDAFSEEHVQAVLQDLKAFEALVRADEREETNRRANASWTLMCEKMVAAERETCAKVCDDIGEDLWSLYKGRAPYTGKEEGRADMHVQGKSDGADECASAIRNRGNT
jgi:hypothetical protein